MHDNTLIIEVRLTSESFKYEDMKYKFMPIYDGVTPYHDIHNLSSKKKLLTKQLTIEDTIRFFETFKVKDNVKLIINFIGQLWEKKENFKDVLLTINRSTAHLMAPVEVYVMPTYGELMKVEFTTGYKLLTNVPTHSLPVRIQDPRLELQLVDDFDDVYNLLTSAMELDLTFHLDHVTFQCDQKYTFIDNGKDSSLTNLLHRLKEDIPGFGIRSFLGDGVLEFLSISGESDYFMRSVDRDSFDGTYIHLDLLDELLEEGFIETDQLTMGKAADVYDEVTFYKLTDKGLAYKSRNTPRVSVSEGISKGDVVCNNLDGSLYKVMDYSCTSDVYNLMKSDCTLFKLTPENKCTFYKATLDERRWFEVNVK